MRYAHACMVYKLFPQTRLVQTISTVQTVLLFSGWAWTGGGGQEASNSLLAVA